MNKRLLGFAIVLSYISFVVARHAASDLPQRVDVEGHRLRLRVEGAGKPTVVLEIGMGGPLEIWTAVQPEVARFTRVVSYDRLGSNTPEAARPGSEVARELHAALSNADLPPPYVLVGQSFGGQYIRSFAHLYPEEVVGLILLDPTQEHFFDWIEVHQPQKSPFRKNKHWVDGPGILATFAEAKSSAPPNVPVVVVTGTRPPPNYPEDEMRPIWTEMHDEWVKTLPQGRHIISDQCGHMVQIEQPQLVIDLIRKMVEQAR